MNGDPTTRSTIISERISWPNGITIDYEDNYIYWVDASHSYIHRANLDGSDRWDNVLYILPQLKLLVVLEVFAQKSGIYFHPVWPFGMRLWSFSIVHTVCPNS